jgi:hypothetical protein
MPGHVDQGRRLPSRAYPRKSGGITSQRPTIHRPQHPQRASLLGFVCPLPGRPLPPIRGDAVQVQDRRSLPRLERAQDAQPPVEDPADTREIRCHRGRVETT